MRPSSRETQVLLEFFGDLLALRVAKVAGLDDAIGSLASCNLRGRGPELLQDLAVQELPS